MEIEFNIRVDYVKVFDLLSRYATLFEVDGALLKCRMLEKAGITLNEKHKLNVKSITFLGHIFTSEGIKLDP